jgi:hypothetical protein
MRLPYQLYAKQMLKIAHVPSSGVKIGSKDGQHPLCMTVKVCKQLLPQTTLLMHLKVTRSLFQRVIHSKKRYLSGLGQAQLPQYSPKVVLDYW